MLTREIYYIYFFVKLSGLREKINIADIHEAHIDYHRTIIFSFSQKSVRRKGEKGGGGR